MRLFTYSSSGNGYKIDLALALLGRHCERIEVAIFQGEGQTPEFLARNPSGRIPVIELGDGTCLPESNAILWYLAQGTWLCPADAVTQARILGWMFFEQNEIEPVLGSARFWRRTGHDRDRRHEPERRIAQSRRSLAILDRHLATQRALVGGTMEKEKIARGISPLLGIGKRAVDYNELCRQYRAAPSLKPGEKGEEDKGLDRKRIRPFRCIKTRGPYRASLAEICRSIRRWWLINYPER